MAIKGIFMFFTLASIWSIVAADTLQWTYYDHETRGGPNNTFLRAAGFIEPNLAIGVNFGSFVVFDNQMREGSEATSKPLGRIAGTGVGVVMPSSTSYNGTMLQVNLQHIFGEGHPYYGSYITFNGIFLTTTGPWEVVGQGAGVLRGYNAVAPITQLATSGTTEPIINIYKWDVTLSKPYSLMN